MSDAAIRLAQYKTAEAAVLSGQRFRYQERDWTMPDLAEIRRAIKDLEAQVAVENRVASGQTGLPSIRAGFNPGFFADRDYFGHYDR